MVKIVSLGCPAWRTAVGKVSRPAATTSGMSVPGYRDRVRDREDCSCARHAHIRLNHIANVREDDVKETLSDTAGSFDFVPMDISEPEWPGRSSIS